MPRASVRAPPPDQIYLSGSGAGTAANTTDFLGQGTDNAVATRAQIVINRPATLRRMICSANLQAGAGETFIYHLMVNNVATTLTVTIGGAVELWDADDVNEVAVVRGDRIEIRLVTSALAAVARHAITIEEDPD